MFHFSPYFYGVEKSSTNRKPIVVIAFVILLAMAALAITVLIPLLEIWTFNILLDEPFQLEYTFSTGAVFAIVNAILIFMYFLLETSKDKPSTATTSEASKDDERTDKG